MNFGSESPLGLAQGLPEFNYMNGEEEMFGEFYGGLSATTQQCTSKFQGEPLPPNDEEGKEV